MNQAVDNARLSNVIQLSQTTKNKKKRKKGINQNKSGSIREISGIVYYDFYYFKKRVRESSGLIWNANNQRIARNTLDEIMLKIQNNQFRFRDYFPTSKQCDGFSILELSLTGGQTPPEVLTFNDHAWAWYIRLRESERISEMTLLSYKGYLNQYLIPFFGDMVFSDFNKPVFDEFIGWAKTLQLRGKSVSNASIKKYFIPLKMICVDAAIQHGWGAHYNPFFGFKMPKDPMDAYEKIHPFTVHERDRIISELPGHWKPYFKFAFYSGISQGEQVAIQKSDIDWNRKTLRIQRAMTRDEKNRPKIGTCKNRFRRRTLNLSPKMFDALQQQRDISDNLSADFFFCSETGKQFDPSNVRLRVWIPALKRAGVEYRQMKQTRHTFATHHLSLGKNPLQIAKFLGHKNADMVINVYAKYTHGAVSMDD